MINPNAFVPTPIDSRDIGVQTNGTPRAWRERGRRAILVLLLMVGSTILVELLRWGIGQLVTGGSTAGQEEGTNTTPTTLTTITTTIITTITSTAPPDLDENVRIFMEDLRRQSLGR